MKQNLTSNCIGCGCKLTDRDEWHYHAEMDSFLCSKCPKIIRGVDVSHHAMYHHFPTVIVGNCAGCGKLLTNKDHYAEHVTTGILVCESCPMTNVHGMDLSEEKFSIHV